MRQTLLNIMAGICILPCLLCTRALLSQPGSSYLLYFHQLTSERRYTAKDAFAYRPPPPRFDHLGFRVARTIRVEQGVSEGVAVFIPYWFLAPLWAIAPGLWLRKNLGGVVRYLQRLRRARKGLCPACGYNIRATPERCPECGTNAHQTVAS